MFDAHGGLTDQKKGVVVCDGCGTHVTLELLEHCSANNIIVVIRTPYCSSTIQFEDIVQFWELKNCKDIGWYMMALEPVCPSMSCSVCNILFPNRYKLKMQQISIVQDRTLGSVSTLNHAEQLKLLCICWRHAFSKEINQRAWHAGGFGADGITMSPLWVQKRKDEGQCKDQTHKACLSTAAYSHVSLSKAAVLCRSSHGKVSVLVGARFHVQNLNEVQHLLLGWLDHSSLTS
jgi:hypothetical protein